jgi:hypothetical protein
MGMRSVTSGEPNRIGVTHIDRNADRIHTVAKVRIQDLLNIGPLA